MRSLRTFITIACVALGATPLVASFPSSTTVVVSSPQIDPGTPVTFTATVQYGGPLTGGVSFYDGTQKLASVILANGVASWTTSALTPGQHTIVGMYSGYLPYDPSSGSVQVLVNNPPPQVVSVTPSHIAAGRLETMIWIRGDWFHVGTSVRVNGAAIPIQVDRRNLLRAILPPSALAYAGPLTIEVVNSGVDVSASTSTTFTVDAPGPPPLALTITTSTVMASPVTPFGMSAVLGVSAIPSNPIPFQTSGFSSPLLDEDGDGVVLFDNNRPFHHDPFPPLTTVSVVDLATGAERVDVPPGSVRNEAFIPFDFVTGMRDGVPTCLSFGRFLTGGVLIRPGVGAWQSFGLPPGAVYPSSFSMNVGSGPPPPMFQADDVIILLAPDTSFMRARLGDYLPVADPATPSLFLEDSSVAEGSSGTSSLEFPLHLTSASSVPVTVHYATGDESATSAGGDYTPVQGDVTFAPGEVLKTISVPVNGDLVYELDEHLKLTLSAASGAPILLGNGHGTIVNDDPAPRVSIGDVTVVEGTGGQKIVEFPVTLSEASSLSTAIHFTLQRGTTDGVEAVLDLNPAGSGGAFIIPAGATQGTIAVRIAGDDLDEDDEQFFIDLVYTDRATIDRSRGTGTILDDDDPPSLTIADAAVVEGTGADRTIDLPVVLSRPSGRAITVDYQLVGGSAAAGTDFVAASGTLVVSGAAPVLPVTIKADAVHEQTEAFTIVLSQPVNVTLARTAVTVTIADDDASGDFNADGSNDLVLRNPATGANALWLLNGTAYLSTVDLPWLPSDFRIEGAADFDGDGQRDLVLRNYANGNNALWLMNGTSIKAIVDLPWLPVAPDFHFEGTGDMNGDGSPDILIRNYTNGNNAVWLMNGTSFSGVANLPALPDPNYKMAGGGDFNADGKADIAWRNQVTGSNAVWLLNGTSLTGIANLPALPNTAYRFNAIADYDGDGQADIALRNYTTGANAFWLLNGTALKSIANLPGLPNTAYEIMGPR